MPPFIFVVVAGTEDDHPARFGDPLEFSVFRLGSIPKNVTAHNNVGKVIGEGEVGDDAVDREDVVNFPFAGLGFHVAAQVGDRLVLHLLFEILPLLQKTQKSHGVEFYPWPVQQYSLKIKKTTGFEVHPWPKII